MTSPYLTRQTLILRASDQGNEKAWKEFVHYYRQYISICLWHLQIHPNESDDITQEVLLSLWKHLSEFDRERAKFRTWISTIIRNAAISHLRKKSRYDSKLKDHGEQAELLTIQPLNSQPAFESFCQKEWESFIVQRAMENITPLFAGKAIEAFNLALAGMETPQIAAKLEIRAQSVLNLKNRVRLKLLAEVKHLRQELEPE